MNVCLCWVVKVITGSRCLPPQVLERDTRLCDLNDKAETLKDNAEVFAVRSKRLRKKMWWKNTKGIFAAVALTLVIVAVVVLVVLV